MLPSEKYEVRLRLLAIEILAYWEGQINTNRICEYFSIKRQQASADINRYLAAINPDSLMYSVKRKAYLPANDFKPVLSQGHINEYMTLISNQSGHSLHSPPPLGRHVISTLKLPDRAIKPEVIRQITQGTQEQTALNIEYASLENPKPHNRIISPHHIIFTGFRWHVRALCHVRFEFRDFLLSRISKAKLNTDVSYEGAESDLTWQADTTLVITPNPYLSDTQKKLIERDFSMTSGKLVLTISSALVQYCLSQYHIDPATTDCDLKANPKKYQLVLAEG